MVSSENVRYAYGMDGFDKVWNDTHRKQDLKKQEKQEKRIRRQKEQRKAERK